MSPAKSGGKRLWFDPTVGGVTRCSLIIQFLIYYEDDYFELEFDLPSVIRCPSMVPSLTLCSLCSIHDLLAFIYAKSRWLQYEYFE